MKQALKTTRIITIGLFTLCTMGLSLATFANVKTDEPIELKFIGKTKDQPVFQLNLNNNETAEYFITIKDRYHNIMFSEKVEGVHISRKYRLDISEEDLMSSDFGISVEVTSAETHKTQVYKISSRAQVVQNFEVARS